MNSCHSAFYKVLLPGGSPPSHPSLQAFIVIFLLQGCHEKIREERWGNTWICSHVTLPWEPSIQSSAVTLGKMQHCIWDKTLSVRLQRVSQRKLLGQMRIRLFLVRGSMHLLMSHKEVSLILLWIGK